MILKRHTLFLFSAFFACLLFSFTGKGKNKKMHAKLYYEWYKSTDFPFRDTIDKEGIKFVCEWIPREVEIARQLVSTSITEKEAKIQLSESENILSFKFYVLLPKPGIDIFNYQLGEGENVTSRTQYFAIDMQKDIHLKSKNSDSIKCKGFIHERGISNYPLSKFEFFFFEKDIEQVKSIYYFDRIYSKEKIEFDLTHLAKTKIPTLII
jgi:hypothetical protein